MVQVWDVRNPSGSVRKICGPSITSDSLDLKNNILLSGNYQNNDTVQLYDFGSGQLIETLDIDEPKNSNSYCFAASFAHHSEFELIAVAFNGSNKVKILKDRIVMGEIKFQATPFSLDFYRWGNKDFLLVGGGEGTVYCFKL